MDGKCGAVREFRYANIPALAAGEQALRRLRLVCEPMHRRALRWVLGLMSVRVTNTQKIKKQDVCPAFCVLVTRTGIEPMFSA